MLDYNKDTKNSFFETMRNQGTLSARMYSDYAGQSFVKYDMVVLGVEQWINGFQSSVQGEAQKRAPIRETMMQDLSVEISVTDFPLFHQHLSAGFRNSLTGNRILALRKH